LAGNQLISSCKSAYAKNNQHTQNPKQKKKKKDSEELTETDRRRLENLFIDGCKEKMAGKLETAEKYFRECQRLDPKNVPVKYELSHILRLTNRLEEATQLGKECVEGDPKNQWYHLAYIECLHIAKDYETAAGLYEKLVKHYPEKVEFYEAMAIEYALARNYSKSFKIYDELEKRYGPNETFTLNKIKLLKEQKKYAESEAELKKLIASNPDEPRFYAYLAEYYEDIKQFDKAKEVYDKILTIDPGNPMVHLALSNYYKDQNRPEEAHNELKIAFANPDLPVETKYDILGEYYKISNQFPDYTERAYELCEIALKAHPTSPEAHISYADFLLRDRKVKEAREHYLFAAYADKTRSSIWLTLLEIEAELNQTDSLEKHSAMGMELFPSQPEYYFYNGISNIQLRNYQKAAQSLNDGLEFVYDKKQLMMEFYSNLGNAYNYIGEYEKSDKAFEDALKVNPDNPYVLNNYSYFLSVRKEKLDKAEKFSRRSNELSPNNRQYIDTYGWILYQLGRYAEAEEWLARAATMGNKSATILEHYGDVLYKLNKKDQAVEQWKLAKEAGGDSEKLQKKISTKTLPD